MNKWESMQSYVMSVSHLRNQLQNVGEPISDRELVMVTLECLPPIWETFSTTINNNNQLHTFDELG